jgi:hypothetical protein
MFLVAATALGVKARNAAVAANPAIKQGTEMERRISPPVGCEELMPRPAATTGLVTRGGPASSDKLPLKLPTNCREIQGPGGEANA